VFVPLNTRTTESEAAKILEITAPAAIVSQDGIKPGTGNRLYADGTALVLWTSGTTGAPKAILHSHTAYLELLDRSCYHCRKRPVSDHDSRLRT
jgi:long-chain acyl-CoA synthetase